MKQILYICDHAKNIECKKNMCYANHEFGCKRTQAIKFAKNYITEPTDSELLYNFMNENGIWIEKCQCCICYDCKTLYYKTENEYVAILNNYCPNCGYKLVGG